MSIFNPYNSSQWMWIVLSYTSLISVIPVLQTYRILTSEVVWDTARLHCEQLYGERLAILDREYKQYNVLTQL